MLVFSNSVPSDVGYNSLEKSINEMSELMMSEMSFTSSVASSRSGFGKSTKRKNFFNRMFLILKQNCFGLSVFLSLYRQS